MILEDIPYKADTEKAVLSCIMINPDLLYQCDLSGDEFYESRHVLIYKAMIKLRDNKKQIDLVTVSKLSPDNLSQYIMELSVYMLVTHGFDSYVSDLKDLYYRREVIKKSKTLIELSKDANQPIESLISETTTFYTNLVSDTQKEQSVDEAIERLISKAGTPDIYIGKWGYDQIDKVFGGIKGGQMTIIAARPGHGKSLLSLNIVSNLMDQKIKSCTISLEMSKEEVIQRLFSIRYKISKTDFETKTSQWIMQTLQDKEHLSDCMELSNYIEVKTPRSIDAIIYNAIYKAYYQQGAKVYIIDYIGLMRAGGNHQNRTYEIGVISRRLKEIALELGIHIVLIAQINRQGANNPKLEDLRDSGSLEQDADNVIAIVKDTDANGMTVGIDVSVLKNRNGHTIDANYKQQGLKIMNKPTS